MKNTSQSNQNLQLQKIALIGAIVTVLILIGVECVVMKNKTDNLLPVRIDEIEPEHAGSPSQVGALDEVIPVQSELTTEISEQNDTISDITDFSQLTTVAWGQWDGVYGFGYTVDSYHMVAGDGRNALMAFTKDGKIVALTAFEGQPITVGYADGKLYTAIGGQLHDDAITVFALDSQDNTHQLVPIAVGTNLCDSYYCYDIGGVGFQRPYVKDSYLYFSACGRKPDYDPNLDRDGNQYQCGTYMLDLTQSNDLSYGRLVDGSQIDFSHWFESGEVSDDINQHLTDYTVIDINGQSYSLLNTLDDEYMIETVNKYLDGKLYDTIYGPILLDDLMP